MKSLDNAPAPGTTTSKSLERPTFTRALMRTLVGFVGLVGIAVVVAAGASSASADQPDRDVPTAPAQATWSDDGASPASTDTLAAQGSDDRHAFRADPR